MTAQLGYPPSRKELARELGRATQPHTTVTEQGIDNHVKALVAKGLLAVTKGRSRSIRVLTPDDVELIRLGQSKTVEESVPARYAQRSDPQPELFAEAIDDTMSGAGIRCGDLMAVKAVTKAENGDIVIAQLATGRCCRRLERLANSMVRLSTMPASAARPIKLDEAALRIDGIVIGTIAFRPVER